MKFSDILFLLIYGYAIIIKSSHLVTIIKEKNSGRVKGELLLLSLIILIGTSIIVFLKSSRE